MMQSPSVTVNKEKVLLQVMIVYATFVNTGFMKTRIERSGYAVRSVQNGTIHTACVGIDNEMTFISSQ